MKTHVASRLAIQLLFAGLVCIAGSSRSAFAVERYVDASNATPSAPYTNWTTAATTIQDAINAAVDGDSVVVTNGTYSTGGKVVYGSFTNRIAIDKPIMVQSLYGPDYTFIEGAGPLGSDAIRCAYVGTNAVLSGFTLTNGHTKYNGHNTKERAGGGVLAEASGVVSNCVVTGCEADLQGGAVAQGTYSSCTFSNNAGGSAGGGAVSAYLFDCLIASNTALTGGGAFNCASVGCTFLENSVSQEGGATCFGSTINSVIRNNQAAKRGGGGIHGTMRNCTIFGNKAETGGGTCAVDLENCTVVGNEAVLQGGGINGGDALNCIVYYNVSQLDTNNNAVLNSWDNYSHTCIDPLPLGAGNISDPPKLQSLSVPRLVISSPCIGAGTNAVWMSTATDIEGDPRISGTIVDMGADEVVVGAQFGAIAVEILTDYTTAVVGHPLRFEAHIEGDIAEFRWDWDDGDHTDNLCVVEHAFDHAGTYDVVLEAGNKTDDAATTTTVTVVESFIAYVSLTGSHASPFANWSDAATNIQAAIDVCIPGGTVLVAEGDYATGAHEMWGAISNRIAVNRPVTVAADGSVKSTRIVGPGIESGIPVRCATLCDGALLTGFTLTGGIAANDNYYSFLDCAGGGVWCAAGGTVSNCIVTGNAAGSCSGGMMGGTVVASEVSLNFTSYGDGGGIAYAHARDCVISGNTCDGDGGGLARGSAEGCTLEGNTAFYGGGASCSTLEDCILLGNHADEGGGTEDCSVRNCILYGNQAIWGGGAHQCVLYGCTITGNSAFRGGGVHDGYDEGVVQNCTVVGNKASGCGGGTWGANVTNSIVYFNTAAMEYDNIDIVDYGSCAYTCTTPDPGGGGGQHHGHSQASGILLSAHRQGLALHRCGFEHDMDGIGHRHRRRSAHLWNHR